MNISDFKYLVETMDTAGLMGSDSSVTNMFLLAPKYNTEFKIQDNFLFRFYYGKDNRYGYGFPLSLQKNAQLSKAIALILSQNTDKTDIHFCLCTQDQKNRLDEVLRTDFPSYKIDWKTNLDDCDYIYLQEKLEKLPGSSLQKKRNHISRFCRTYEDHWNFKSFNHENLTPTLLEDILKVEETWFLERSTDVEKAFDEHTLLLEKDSIHQAVENADVFKLYGGIIYIDENPVAMCLASPISSDTIDIHFEKVLSEVAQNGGYAAINNFFVKTLSYKYINREEDMGVEGLRKAKQSYKPELLLDKFYGRLVKC